MPNTMKSMSIEEELLDDYLEAPPDQDAEMGFFEVSGTRRCGSALGYWKSWSEGAWHRRERGGGKERLLAIFGSSPRLLTS